MNTPRNSKCHKCRQPIKEQPVIKASDSNQYINEYGTYDDDLVWIAKDTTAICFSDQTAHYTTKEWNTAQ